MSAALKRMTPDEFLTWCLHQEGRWELVNGEPIQMMAGAAVGHDEIVVNILVAMDRRLEGTPCRPRTADVGSRMVQGNIRRPDVTIDCRARDRTSLLSAEPTVFFEVLSPSTRAFDLVGKPDEYRQLLSLKQFVLVDPERARVKLYSREPDGWTTADIVGLGSVVPLPGIETELTLAEIYRNVDVES